MNPQPFSLALLLATTGWPALAADPPIEAFVALPPEESSVAVLPPGATPAAGELAAAAACHPTKHRAALVALSWRPAGQDGATADGPDAPPAAVPAADQRVELTKFRDGFGTGRLLATRRLATEVNAVAVDSPETGINYYWRVLTLTAQGWAPSATGRFEVPICPYDAPDLSRFEGTLNDDPRDRGPSRR